LGYPGIVVPVQDRLPAAAGGVETLTAPVGLVAIEHD